MRADTRVCRYEKCVHPSRDVDISGNEFVKVGTKYFHKDCYNLWKEENKKSDDTKKDLQFIKTFWVDRISKTVSYGDLFRILNGFLARGISSDYLVFVVRYCVDHGYKLNYPAGLTYYIDRGEIKDAYARHKIEKVKRMHGEDIQTIVKEKEKNDDAPTFNFNRKQKGFQSIFGKGE